MVTSMALARSVLLKQSNSQMNATAVILGIMLKTACLQVHVIIIYLNNEYVHIFTALSNIQGVSIKRRPFEVSAIQISCNLLY